MPDVWTRHPDIVRELLKEGGFTCGVAPRILKGRDPEWTCIIDGKRISGDLYIHHVDTLRSGLGIQDAHLPVQAAMGTAEEWGTFAIILLAALIFASWRCARRSEPPQRAPERVGGADPQREGRASVP